MPPPILQQSRAVSALKAALAAARERRAALRLTAALIALLLKEPERGGERILRQSLRLDARLQRSYQKLLADKDAVLRLVKRACTSDLDAINHWLLPGRPRILASAHTSNYLLGVLVLLHQVQPIGDVMLLKRTANSAAEQLFMRFAADYCDSLRTVGVDGGGIKAALKHLRGGGCLIMMIDVPFHLDVGAGELVEFFGEPLIAAAAIGRLALKTGASVVPAAMITQDGGAAVSLRQPFIATNELTSGDIARRLMLDVEHWVSLAPEDWLIWGHFRYWHSCSAKLVAQAAQGASQDGAKSHKMVGRPQVPEGLRGDATAQSEDKHQITSSAA